MLGVMLVCAAPVIASYFTYYVIRPEGRRAYGELVDQRVTPEGVATTLDGRAVPLQSLRNQWLLVSVAPAACGPTCQQHLYLQRQLRESLGREKDRLDWIWFVTDGGTIPDSLQQGVSTATVLRIEPGLLARWISPQPGHSIEDHLYVIDPMGNWMMRFPAAMDVPGAARAKRDLERLLRASASWDQAGRPAKEQ
jgi:hypothetical protein